MLRRLFIALSLLAVGCHAQSAPPANLNLRIEQQVRSTLQVPPYVKIAVGQRSPSEFTGYDNLKITLSLGQKTKDLDFLISKDNKTLMSVSKIDLTKDPYADIMNKIDIKGRPFRGNKDAKVLVVVYDDYQCPFCSRMHETIVDTLKTYGDRIKVVYKDFPLVEIHPWAGRAAVDSECLANLSSGAFWDFADYVHGNGPSISGKGRPLGVQEAEVDRIATQMGQRHAVDMTKLTACIKEQPHAQLDASMKEAESLGVQATPSIFVNGMKMDGAVSEDAFKAVLDQALADVGESAPAATTPAAANSDLK